MKNAVASNWVAETCVAEGSGFTLKGTSKGYTSFSDAFSAGDQVFYSAHDDQGNREAGYATFDGVGLVDREPTATLVNGVYNKSPALSFKFDGEITIACTFNAVAFNVLWKALDAIDPDGDGNINIPPELIDGLIDKLDTKAEQDDLEQEIQDRIDGDKALQDQIDALDPDGDRKVDWSEIDGKPSEFPPSAHNHAWDQITGKPSEFPPADHNHDGDYLKTETDPTVPDHVKAITTDDIDNWNANIGAASTWDELTGKPTEFPPEAHTQDWSTITNTPSEYPPEDHTHSQSEVDGLELRLEAIEDSITSGGGFVDAPNDGQLYGRQSEAWAVVPTGGASSWDDLTGKPSEFPPEAHNHDGVYAPIDHTHEIADVDGLQDALDAAGGAPSWDDVTGKPTEFPPESHTHEISDVDGLQDALDAASESLWTQTGDDIYYNDGNVAIGGDPNNRPLKVQQTGQSTYLSVVSDPEFTAGVLLGDTDSDAQGRVSYDNALSQLQFFTNSATQVVIDGDGNMGIGGEPGTRAIDEAKALAKEKLTKWKAEVKKRTAEQPEASTQEITLEVTDGGFEVMPTEQALAEWIQARSIGGGDAKLQVNGDGYFSGAVNTGTLYAKQNVVVGNGGTKKGFIGAGTAGLYIDGVYNEIRPWNSSTNAANPSAIDFGSVADKFKDAYFSGVVNADTVISDGRTVIGPSAIYDNYNGNAVGIAFMGGSAVSGALGNGAPADGEVSLGRSDSRWKDGHFSGTVNAATINGKVTDVPDHVKAITPTQIANWDAGTGGGGGATTDGRISDTQITNWDTAYGWGNHASAGYQPAGNYLTPSSLTGYATESWVNSQGFAKGSFVPTSGNTTISGTLTATDFVATSDERLKDNISPMPVGLIDDIKPVQWTWKDSGKKSAGVIAQQLQEVGLDDFVTEGEDGMLGVNYNALVSVLLAEVISLKKELAK